MQRLGVRAYNQQDDTQYQRFLKNMIKRIVAPGLSHRVLRIKPIHNQIKLDHDCMQEKILSVLPTIGFVNVPGDPNDRDCGGTISGDGAVILTETKMILFCSRANRSGSAADSIEGTTDCFCFPGFCGPCVCLCEKREVWRARERVHEKTQRRVVVRQLWRMQGCLSVLQ